jgi:hypothetical protein
MTPRHTFSFRTNILIVAGILAVQAAWLVSVEFIRPIMPYFPQDKASEEQASGSRSAAITAASIGWARGDLWTDAAVALSSGLISDVASEGDPQMTLPRDQGRLMAQRAAKLAPHDSRNWLLLAALDSRFDLPSEIANRLKMSYFTGPNDPALTPLRIRVATRSTAIIDTELQSLVAEEIRTVILRRKDEIPSLLEAYRGGSLEGKQFIEATVDDLDKNLLATIRGGGHRQ